MLSITICNHLKIQIDNKWTLLFIAITRQCGGESVYRKQNRSQQPPESLNIFIIGTLYYTPQKCSKYVLSVSDIIMYVLNGG